MKVCIREHEAPGFGTIPVGSLWDDDSPYIGESDAFADVLEGRPVKPEIEEVTNDGGAGMD